MEPGMLRALAEDEQLEQSSGFWKLIEEGERTKNSVHARPLKRYFHFDLVERLLLPATSEEKTRRQVFRHQIHAGRDREKWKHEFRQLVPARKEISGSGCH